MKPVGPAEAALAGRLARLVETGRIPICATDPERWFADSPEERMKAAADCAGCFVFAECADTADELRPRFGVWAGRDRTPRPRKPRTR